MSEMRVAEEGMRHGVRTVWEDGLGVKSVWEDEEGFPEEEIF